MLNSIPLPPTRSQSADVQMVVSNRQPVVGAMLCMVRQCVGRSMLCRTRSFHNSQSCGTVCPSLMLSELSPAHFSHWSATTSKGLRIDRPVATFSPTALSLDSPRRTMVFDDLHDIIVSWRRSSRFFHDHCFSPCLPPWRTTMSRHFDNLTSRVTRRGSSGRTPTWRASAWGTRSPANHHLFLN